MAIVIKTEPRLFSPVYNLMETAVFESGLVIFNPNFRYVFDIVINLPAGGTETIRTKVTPEPNQSFGIQDLSGHIEKYVLEEIVPFDNTKSFRSTDNGILKYHVEYGEEYSITVTDPIVVYPNLTTGTNKYAWGGSLEHHRWIDFYNNSEYTDYLQDLANKGGFLTNYRTPNVRITDLGWTWFLTNVPTEVDYLEVKTYDSSAALISTFQIDKTVTGSSDQDRMQSIPTSPQSLNNVTDPFILGAQPVIISTVAAYTIQCFDTSTVNVSSTMTFIIEEDCFYEVYRIHFENEDGGFDSYNFRLNSKRKATGEKKFYTTNSPSISSTGITYDHSQESKVNHYTKLTDKVDLISDFLTEEQNNWIKELAFSTRMYLEFADNSGVANFNPCVIRSASWLEKKTAVDKLFTIEFDGNCSLG